MAGAGEPLDWERVVRQAVIPVATAYAGWIWLLVVHRRRGGGRLLTDPAPDRAPASYRDLARYLLALAAGGFAIFLAIVAVFYLVLGGQSADLLREAVVEGSWLAFGIVVPGWLAISWLYDRRRPRR